MNIKTLGITGIVAMLAGCAGAPVALNYEPSSTMIMEGELQVGDFKYLPGEKNKKIAANQIRNAAFGSLILDKSVDKYFEIALVIESKSVGLEVKRSDNKLTGNIIEFFIDDFGYSVNWILEVNYVINKPDGSDCYNKVHKIERNTTKFSNTFDMLNEVMKLNIEAALKDEDFVSCIAKKAEHNGSAS